MNMHRAHALDASSIPFKLILMDRAPSSRFRRLRVLFLVLLTTICAHAQTQIPTIAGSTFAGAKVKLPDAFAGKSGVIVLGFSQGSRDQITAWGKRLAVDYFDSPTVAYYEMPVLAGVPGFMRGFVLGRIKSSVSERGKVHFLPILDNEPAWRAVAQYATSDPNAPYVLVVDGSGRVRWRTRGPLTDATYEQLRKQVEAAHTGR